MKNSIVAFGAFGEVGIPAVEVKFGIVRNRAAVSTDEFGGVSDGYTIPAGAFNCATEMSETAHQRGHDIELYITAPGMGTFYTIVSPAKSLKLTAQQVITVVEMSKGLSQLLALNHPYMIEFLKEERLSLVYPYEMVLEILTAKILVECGFVGILGQFQELQDDLSIEEIATVVSDHLTEAIANKTQ